MERIGKRRTLVQRSQTSTYAVHGSARRSGWLAFRPVSKQVLILRTWVVCLVTVAFHLVPKQVSPINLPSTTFGNRGISPGSKATKANPPTARICLVTVAFHPIPKRLAGFLEAFISLVTVAFHPIPKPVRSESLHELGLCVSRS